MISYTLGSQLSKQKCLVEVEGGGGSTEEIRPLVNNTMTTITSLRRDDIQDTSTITGIRIYLLPLALVVAKGTLFNICFNWVNRRIYIFSVLITRECNETRWFLRDAWNRNTDSNDGEKRERKTAVAATARWYRWNFYLLLYLVTPRSMWYKKLRYDYTYYHSMSAFVLAPLASNSIGVVSSMHYASKKTV